MKKVFLSLMAASLFMAACNSAPEGEEAEVTAVEETATESEPPAGEPYAVAATSKITFYGASPTHGQNGQFAVSEGTLYVQDGNITGGTINVDLNDMSITTEGLEDEKKGKLKGHLLSADFFNAESNPSVTFELTGVEPLEGNEKASHTITGNLAMNGQTNQISFPAKVGMSETGIDAGAEFVINRKDWGMSYKNDESLGDDWIYDEVKMTLALTAAK